MSSSNSIASSSVIAFPTFSCHEFSCLTKISLATAWQALHRDRIGPPHCLIFFFFFSFLQSDNSTNSTRANTIACRMLAERIVLLEARGLSELYGLAAGCCCICGGLFPLKLAASLPGGISARHGQFQSSGARGAVIAIPVYSMAGPYPGHAPRACKRRPESTSTDHGREPRVRFRWQWFQVQMNKSCVI